MHTTPEIKQLVQQNIHQIKISEFVVDGGWPIIDAIDVTIFSHIEEGELETINLHILYTIHRAGCCFIPGREEILSLPKIVTIQNNKIKFL